MKKLPFFIITIFLSITSYSQRGLLPENLELPDEVFNISVFPGNNQLQLSCWYPDNGEFGGHLETFLFERSNDSLIVTFSKYAQAIDRLRKVNRDIIAKYNPNNVVLDTVHEFIKKMFLYTMEEKSAFSNGSHIYTAELSNKIGEDSRYMLNGFKIAILKPIKWDDFELIKEFIIK